MKFSILLPTKNRLFLLKYAVESVLRQNYSDFEIVISDNNSSEPIEDYVKSLSDNRIIYSKSHTSLTVTENWNRALNLASGDYILMLGDDDAIMPDYFATVVDLIKKYEQPEVIYTNAFLYAYPGVMPGESGGYLASYSSKPIYRNSNDDYVLSAEEAIRLVQCSLDFKMRFDYNMQFPLIKKELVKKITQQTSPFFQSPYPDYYATNACFLVAKEIVICPKPLVIIGISPKSFGFYYFNDQESAGTSFLSNILDPSLLSSLKPHLLSGTNMNTSWLGSMESLYINFKTYSLPRPNYARYRLLQICAFLNDLVLKKERHFIAAVVTYSKNLSTFEIIFKLIPLAILAALGKNSPSFIRNKIPGLFFRIKRSHQYFNPGKIKGRFSNILEVCKNAESRFDYIV